MAFTFFLSFFADRMIGRWRYDGKTIKKGVEYGVPCGYGVYFDDVLLPTLGQDSC